jgi:hypothetical protein
MDNSLPTTASGMILPPSSLDPSKISGVTACAGEGSDRSTPPPGSERDPPVEHWEAPEYHVTPLEQLANEIVSKQYDIIDASKDTVKFFMVIPEPETDEGKTLIGHLKNKTLLNTEILLRKAYDKQGKH